MPLLSLPHPLVPLALLAALIAIPATPGSAAPPAAPAAEPVRFHSFGTKLPGSQLMYDAGFEVMDWDGDGKPDLVLEGYNRGELEHYRRADGPGMRVKKVGLLGSPLPIRYPSGYRYFAVSDVDGDGVPDLLNSASTNVALFRGVKPGAPLPEEVPVYGSKAVVLRNGPKSGEAPSYTGCSAVTLDAQKPNEVSSKKPSALVARAQIERGEKQKLVIVRFKDLPADAPNGRAYLELTTDPTLQDDPALLQNMATLAVSCSAIRADWDAAAATFATAAPGKPWAKDELDAGGTFLSFAKPEFTVRERQTLRWDVTEAVKAARAKGTAVSLLVRVEYTGPYVGGLGYKFCGVDHPNAAHRPRLVLTADR